MLDERIENTFELRFFNFRRIILSCVIFLAMMIVLNFIARFVFKYIAWFDCLVYWPLSISYIRIPGFIHFITAAAAALLFCISITLLQRMRYRILPVIITGIVLVLATNIIHGWKDGFVTPTSGGVPAEIQYYHDAKKIEDPIVFIAEFEEKQPDLLIHSRTHPPGSVLAFYYLNKAFGNPALISIVIAIVSVSLSALFLCGILSQRFDDRRFAGFVTFLFILIPSIQIYYAASIDALIASFLTGALFFHLRPRLSTSVTGTLIFLVLSSLITFGFLFFLPVMLGFDIIERKSLKRSGLIILGLAVFYIIIFAVSGFNYLNSFLTASKLENPNGFFLLSDPLSYFFTRLESVFEVIIFFGPFLAILMWRGFRLNLKKRSTLLTPTMISIPIFLIMLLTGTYRTGETARTCLYIYPYLVFPVAQLLGEKGISTRNEKILLSLVFVQTLFMQMLGNYFW